MKTIGFLLISFAAIAMMFTGCNKYDDSDIREKIASLESATKQFDAQVKAGALISSVTAIESGWRISFTGGTTSYIDILHGKDGIGDSIDSSTPVLDVRQNANGTTTIWVDYGNGWKDTNVNLAGPKGISPKIKVETNDDGTTIWYNITEDYPETGWIDTEFDISAIGPVLSIIDNEDGTVTITMNDATDKNPDTATKFTFEKASPAFRFEILTYEAVSIRERETGTVLFIVNPSTAWIPITGDGGIDKWYLNSIGTRAPGYVQASSAFEITKIEASPKGRGEYVATIRCKEGSYDPEANNEQIVTLVLNAGDDDDPVLISSSPFPLSVAMPTVITIDTHPASETNLTAGSIPADTKFTVTASVTEGATLAYQWYRNNSASNAEGTAIEGATDQSYTIPTDSEAGTYYYFVEVSATGGAVPVRSNVATVTIAPNPKYYDTGVVIGDITWATRNVGNRGEFISVPSDYGNYYSFEEAQTACPDGWRTPTRAEFQSLADTGSKRTTVNNVKGYRFGSDNNTIFLPATGQRSNNGIVYNKDVNGYYWSSAPYNQDYGYHLFFTTTDYVTLNYINNTSNFSIRCVR
ncbi:MAG: hypothetical protein LBV47_09630 [Bacteroidales bacterium]|jgi:uncharacterized protein (TIGR02145 family)|nr:hypothetical protein [Bacteroidales bacterium]